MTHTHTNDCPAQEKQILNSYEKCKYADTPSYDDKSAMVFMIHPDMLRRMPLDNNWATSTSSMSAELSKYVLTSLTQTRMMDDADALLHPLLAIVYCNRSPARACTSMTRLDFVLVRLLAAVVAAAAAAAARRYLLLRFRKSRLRTDLHLFFFRRLLRCITI